MKLFKQLLIIFLLMTIYYLCFGMNLQEPYAEQQNDTSHAAIYPEEALPTTLRSALLEIGQAQSTESAQADDVNQAVEASGAGQKQEAAQDVSQDINQKVAGWREEPDDTNKDAVEIPILLYHHIAEEANGDVTISERTFRSHMEAVDAAGYHTITFEELVAYVEDGAELPEKPLILTFDDGYLSNYEIAYPILKEFGMKATIFPIGVSLGTDVYKDTGIAITPHFGIDEIKEMTASGVISIQSHTYDMHQVGKLDDVNTYRVGVLPRNGESDVDYKYAFYRDAQLFRDLLSPVLDEQLMVFSYPFGAYSEDTEAWLEDMGFKVTLIIRSSNNIVERENSDSLKLMSRYDITEAYSDTDLLALLP